jgi:hypothetical protein
MYIRKLNIDSKTAKEARVIRKEYFCSKILPVLNMVENKETGYDFANYIINKERENNYGSYLYNQYSGQIEERLFREAEEAKYLNKNEPFVERVSYSNVIKERIGIKPKELDNILNNPTTSKKMRTAMKHKYKIYEPVKEIDYIASVTKKNQYIDTIIERELDPSSPDFNTEDLFAMTYDKGDEENEEAQVMMATHVNYPVFPGVDNNSYPYGIYNFSKIYYHPKLDYNDYAPDFYDEDFLISPKKNRYEMHNNFHRTLLDSFFVRSYNNPIFANRRDYIIPSIDYKNEELKSKVLRRSNYKRYLDNFIIRDSDMEKLEFLENKTMQDSYQVSEDITEEELDQAIFESTYAKPPFESDEIRGNLFIYLFNQDLLKEPIEKWNNFSRYLKWILKKIGWRLPYKKFMIIKSNLLTKPKCLIHWLI